MNEELLKEIKGMLPWLVVAAVAVGGYYGVKNHMAAKKAASSLSLVTSVTAADFEDAVSKYGSSDAGGALKLKLAKRYFDDGRYDEALAKYDELAKAAPDGFDGVPAVGRAVCLEAKGQYAEAKAAFEAFAGDAANAKSFLLLTAKVGAIRATALGGDREGALKAAAALKESVAGDELAKARVEQLEDLVKRLAK